MNAEAEKREREGADDDRQEAKKRKAQYVKKIIETLQDRCEETGKDLEAPPIVRKVLNIIFLVLGICLLFGVLIAVIVTVFQEVDSRNQSAEAARGQHKDKPKILQQTIRQAQYISWPPKLLGKHKAPN